MSSRPGYTLEAFLAWQWNLVVQDQDEANVSLGIAEALGTATRYRPCITQAQFQPLVALYEPYREAFEDKLADFDDDNQSWRDYAGCAFDYCAPPEVDQQAQAYVRGLTAPDQPTPE